MTQQNNNMDTAAPEAPELSKSKSDNLLQLQNSSNETQVLEINKQMTNLETSIAQLNKKLNTTNKQIKSDVTRLTKSDAEITDKVAETYRHLGQIEVTFQDLGKKSKKITGDIKSINSTLKVFEKASSDALNLAIENQSEVNDNFKQQHESLIDRAEKLSKKADTINRKLKKSITDNSLALSELEAKIITELENVAQSSKDRDSHLDGKIDTTNKEVIGQKANMLLMQSVDEALDKRASALEKTAQQLLTDSDELKESTEVLNILTGKLSSDIDALEIHTASLSIQNAEQQGFIEKLQIKTDSMARTLLALATLEKKHFRVLASVSLLILLAVIGVFFYGEYQRDTQLATSTQINTEVNNQLEGLKNRVQDEQLASQVFYSDITDLQKNIGQLKKELDGVNTQVVTINEQVVEMNDQVESIDGRVQYIAPLYNFGTDNTIHGSEWLSNLDETQFSIQVATVKNKQELYETASRYNHYLKQDLAYFINEDGSFTLLHGGKYQNEQELKTALRDMPSYINFQRVSSISNAEILGKIKQI